MDFRKSLPSTYFSEAKQKYTYSCKKLKTLPQGQTMDDILCHLSLKLMKKRSEK